jgi:hypothetical protein
MAYGRLASHILRRRCFQVLERERLPLQPPKSSHGMSYQEVWHKKITDLYMPELPKPDHFVSAAVPARPGRDSSGDSNTAAQRGDAAHDDTRDLRALAHRPTKIWEELIGKGSEVQVFDVARREADTVQGHRLPCDQDFDNMWRELLTRQTEHDE